MSDEATRRAAEALTAFAERIGHEPGVWRRNRAADVAAEAVLAASGLREALQDIVDMYIPAYDPPQIERARALLSSPVSEDR